MTAGGDSRQPKRSTSGPIGEAELIRGALAHEIVREVGAHQQFRGFLRRHVARFDVPESAEAWTAKAEELRRRILDEVVMKGVPRAWLDQPPRIEEVGRIETKHGYSIRKFRFEGYPGLWIPALLYEPTNLEGKAPVVLNFNGHIAEPGKSIDYKQVRCINLAKRGMLALNVEWLNCGELHGECYVHQRMSYLELCGRSGLSVFYLPLKRALDMMLQHPNADPKRVAATGLSGGGWQALLLAALDPRVSACVPVAGYITLDARAKYRSDTGDFEESPPDLLAIADYTHLTAMLAPRPVLLIYNDKDSCCYPTERAKGSVYDPVAPIYELFGAQDEFEFHSNSDPGDHNYEKDNREAMYRFLDARFYPDGSKPDVELPCDAEIRTAEDLSVGLPKNNADFCTLAEGLAAELPRMRVPNGHKTEILAWQGKGRRKLSEILKFRLPKITTRVTQRQSFDDLTITWRLFLADREWMIPAVEFESASNKPRRTAIVIADDGRPSAQTAVCALLRQGYRVIALDLLLFGETVPSRVSPTVIGRLISAAGGRPLGLAAAHLSAIAAHLKQSHEDRAVSLIAVGAMTSVVALATAAMDHENIHNVTTFDLPASLKLLIEDRILCQHLFCFGLLEQFDIRELSALALPTPLRIVRPQGADRRIDEAFEPLERIAEALGAQPIQLEKRSSP